jgi:hypothetical protein
MCDLTPPRDGIVALVYSTVSDRQACLIALYYRRRLVQELAKTQVPNLGLTEISADTDNYKSCLY